MTDDAKKPKLSAPERHTRVRQERFLAALATGLSITGACNAVGISRGTVYGVWLKALGFRTQYDEAVEYGTQVLEDEARRRAVEGVSRPIFQQGKHVGDEQIYSDRLLEFLLRSRRPTVYRDNVNVSGHTSQTIRSDAEETLAKTMLDIERSGGCLRLPPQTVARLINKGLLPADSMPRFGPQAIEGPGRAVRSGEEEPRANG